MKKIIPYSFECVPVSSIQPLNSNACNIGRMNVGVFTKYGNRNGSYITDKYAEYLIETAPNCPVVGFFDRETQDWQGHVGPTLASAYGYVDYFVGWQPLVDTDGIEREYAVFSVVVFSDYFEEARHILGKAQSMEINPETIEGDWIDIDGQEYFVYTTGKMAGFCILGDSKEPCFSASSFFEKREGETQFEQFSSLLFDLKAKVEEAEKFEEGGEQSMEENMILEPVVETPAEETPVVEENNFEENAPMVEEQQEVEPTFEEAESEVLVEEEPAADFNEVEEPAEEPSEFEELQNSFNELQNNYAALQTSNEELTAQLNDANSQIQEFEQQINALNEQLAAANNRLQEYDAAAALAEEARKNSLVDSYEKLVSAEEIESIRASIADFSYDEVESKLAIAFSRKAINEKATKVPVIETEESAFATLMKKYKK